MVLSLMAALALQGGLQKLDTVVGHGEAAKIGDYVTVDYTGKLTNGTQFDTSKQAGRGPFSIVLGAGSVIKGWDQGIQGMKVGGKRRLTIPASLGYGATGTPGGPIPPNATLVFDVEMKSIEHVGVVVLKPGSGVGAAGGDSVTVSYVGTLKSSGKEFDKGSFPFRVGRGVVPGFSAGVLGMKLGEKRRVTIPSKMGYGEKGTPDGTIPPNADLVFEITLTGLNGRTAQ